ncbi:UNVERIFIED_CONTAM: hypothetical protein K2H54_077908 [Gekko kuhli]
MLVLDSYGQATSYQLAYKCSRRARAPHSEVQMGALTYGHLLGLLVAHFLLPGTEAACPSSWLEYNRHCYGVESVPRTWMGAEVECQNRASGGHLASLLSEAEHAAVANYLTANYPTVDKLWIALHDPRHTRSWQWSDSGPLFYQAWNTGEPNNKGGREYCVHLCKGTGTDAVDCPLSWIYFQEHCYGVVPGNQTWVGAEVQMGVLTYGNLFGLLVAHFLLPGTEVACPAKWLDYQAHCYGVGTIPRTWMGAEIECQNRAPGGHLSSLLTEAEHAAVANYVTHNYPTVDKLWIALHDPRHTRNWQWRDSTPLLYQAWNTGEPNNRGGREYCVHISKGAGFKKWNDADCILTMPALCKTKL